MIRGLLRCKRKSDPHVDENQDGARAAIIEEAVAILAFNYARDHSWLQGLDRIDQGLLKHIAQLVRGLEVEDCAAWEWQRAILTGFEVFRALRDHHGGRVIVDADERRIDYAVLAAGMS